jgi:GR25 family glycosyltransferase involved in LPS biosynthesis
LYRPRSTDEGFQSTTTMFAEPAEMILINMDSRKDRLDNFTRTYNNSDVKDVIPLKRQSAVVGKNVDWRPLVSEKVAKEMDENVKSGRRIHLLTPGGIGCYLSHLEAYNKCVRSGKPIIICEDDIELTHDFHTKIKTALTKVPYNENTVILFHAICSGQNHKGDVNKCTPIEDNLYDVERFWSLACYYITPTAAQTILDNSKPIEYEIDALIGKLKRDGKLNLYYYAIVQPGLLGTDIQLM